MKTISDHILDLLQNSVRANATLIEIIVDENKKNDICTVIIKDNGCGMNEDILKIAANPFFTSRDTRKIGLGLSLFKQNAEKTNGSFCIQSEVNKGTEVKAVFQLSHFDKPPLGEIWDTYLFTLMGNENIELNYRHKTEIGNFSICSAEIIEMLDGIPLKQKEIREAVTEIIKNNLKDIKTTN
jgi:hypothetical protein